MHATQHVLYKSSNKTVVVILITQHSATTCRPILLVTEHLNVNHITILFIPIKNQLYWWLVVFWLIHGITCWLTIITVTTRMWDNAQRDGCPAEYRWRPLFNAAVWRSPTTWLPCSNAAKTRKPLKLAGVSKLPNRSPPPLPYCEDIWRTYCCVTSFFPIVDTCLSCEDIARQSCAMVLKWRFFASCIFSKPRAAHFRHAF